ncbi:hypothetical protein M885DRAFT_184918 [Pelagophyceae sp. CCMP2097]|nr:hypothetical protein M885DRAFT_184918 [Pelagophyceae sp. CCMP2097]
MALHPASAKCRQDRLEDGQTRRKRGRCKKEAGALARGPLFETSKMARRPSAAAPCATHGGTGPQDVHVGPKSGLLRVNEFSAHPRQGRSEPRLEAHLPHHFRRHFCTARKRPFLRRRRLSMPGLPLPGRGIDATRPRSTRRARTGSGRSESGYGDVVCAPSLGSRFAKNPASRGAPVQSRSL